MNVSFAHSFLDVSYWNSEHIEILLWPWIQLQFCKRARYAGGSTPRLYEVSLNAPGSAANSDSSFCLVIALLSGHKVYRDCLPISDYKVVLVDVSVLDA